MTIDRAKTIEMARQAGFGNILGGIDGLQELEHFAALVRAQVLEEAARACEQMARDDMPGPVLGRSIRLAAALRGMKSDSGHSTRAVAEASTTPAQGAA